MFSIEEDGYDKAEVDKKIATLTLDITNLKHSNEEKDRLNLGLANALEKAKQIEASSTNLYNLKTQKIIVLYHNLEKSFANLFKLYPQVAEFNDLKKLFDEFAKTVEVSLKTEMSKNINSPVKTENDTIRLLLNKMSNYSKPKANEIIKEVSLKRKDTKTDVYFDKPSLIKPISNLELKTNENFETIADKFLESTGKIDSVYAQKLASKRKDDLYPTPNESGFDLKEAINPKQDLSEIMKSFNFEA